MEHYITEITVNKLRHLSNITILLNPDARQHLIITGKNGSGKTSLLLGLRNWLRAINDEHFKTLVEEKIPALQKIEKRLNCDCSIEKRAQLEQQYDNLMLYVSAYANGIQVSFSNYAELEYRYKHGDFITACFTANRKTQITRSKGAEDVRLNDVYEVDSDPGEFLHKYMVHLKTQQAYARNEGDLVIVDRIQAWFDRFVDALRILLDDDTVTLEYDYKEYDFKIHESGRLPFGFDELSDGYSSVIHIVSDLILRMDRNWLLGDKLSQYDIEGIAFRLIGTSSYRIAEKDHAISDKIFSTDSVYYYNAFTLYSQFYFQC